MISYSIYKIVHLTGVMMVLLSLGGVAMNAIIGGAAKNQWRKPATITHGIGLLFVLVGGFGMLARLGLAHDGLPGWIIAKLLVWLAFGAFLGVLIRKPQSARSIWYIMIALGAVATYLAGYKPF